MAYGSALGRTARAGAEVRVTEATWFALIAVLALAGWGATLVAMTKAALSSANQHKVLQQILDREDAKVTSLLALRERMRNHGKDETAPPNPAREQSRERADPMATLFGNRAPSSVFVDEQPEPGLEVVES